MNSVPSVLKNDVSNESVSADLEDTLEHLLLQLEHAQSMAKDSPNVFLKASMNIAAMEMFSVLNRFDSVALSKRLDEKPELYFQLLNSQSNLTKAHLDQQKFEFRQKQAETKQRERQQKLRARKPILITSLTLASLTRDLVSSGRHEEAGSSVNSVSSVSSVLRNEPQRLVTANTANTGTTDVLDLKSTGLPQQTIDDQSAVGEPRRDHLRSSAFRRSSHVPDTTDFEPAPVSVCSDPGKQELACCPG